MPTSHWQLQLRQESTDHWYTERSFMTERKAKHAMNVQINNGFDPSRLRVVDMLEEPNRARHEREQSAKDFAKQEAALKKKEAAIDAKIAKKSLLGVGESLTEGAARRMSTADLGSKRKSALGPGYKKAEIERAAQRGRDLEIGPPAPAAPFVYGPTQQLWLESLKKDDLVNYYPYGYIVNGTAVKPAVKATFQRWHHRPTEWSHGMAWVRISRDAPPGIGYTPGEEIVTFNSTIWPIGFGRVVEVEEGDRYREGIEKRASMIESGDPPLAFSDPWEPLFDKYNAKGGWEEFLTSGPFVAGTNQLLFGANNALQSAIEQADMYHYENARSDISVAKQKLLQAIPQARAYGPSYDSSKKKLESIYEQVSQLEGLAYSYVMRHRYDRAPALEEIAKRASMIEINPRRRNPDRGFLTRARMFIEAEIKDLKFRYDRCRDLGGQCNMLAKAINCPWVEKESHVLECLHEIGHARTIPGLYKSAAFTSVRSETRAVLWAERDAWVWALKAWKRLGGPIPLDWKEAEFVYYAFGSYVLSSKQDRKWVQEHLPDLRDELAVMGEFLPMEPFLLAVGAPTKKQKPVLSYQDEIAARARMIELNPRSSFANGLNRYLGRR